MEALPPPRIPPPSKWIPLREASRKMKVPYRRLYDCWRIGRKRDGQYIKLQTWATPMGRVVTDESLADFFAKINA